MYSVSDFLFICNQMFFCLSIYLTRSKTKWFLQISKKKLNVLTTHQSIGYITFFSLGDKTVEIQIKMTNLSDKITVI